MDEQPTVGMLCRACGRQADTPGQAFCASCGTPLGVPLAAVAVPPTLPPPPPPPSFAQPLAGYQPPPSRRSPTPVVAVVVAVVLLLGAAIGGGWLLLAGGGSDETTSSTSAPIGTQPASSAATGPSSAPTSGPTSSASPHACWYGGPTTGTCRWPAGRSGLRWVFPSACGIRGAEGDSRQAASWCLPHFHYSGWGNHAQMLRNYAPDFLPDRLPAPVAGTVARRVASPNASYKVVIYYADVRVPWDVTVYADSRADYERLVAQIRLRPGP